MVGVFLAGTRPFTKSRQFSLITKSGAGEAARDGVSGGKEGRQGGGGVRCKEGQGAWGGEEIFEVRDAS